MSVKSDLMKQIADKVARKKVLAKNLTRDKTIAFWAAEFFTEINKVKNLDTYGSLGYLALEKFVNNLRSLDSRVRVMYDFYQEREGIEPKVEIHWSKTYVTIYNCELITVIDASSAFFQSAMENI